VLEIGSGMGHSTVLQAVADPSTDILAVDVHTPGIAALLLKCESAGVKNVRAAIGDAVEVVEHMLTSQQLAGARVFFPDPWPKIRHRKRRLIQPEFVDLLVSRLRPGGFIHCATDDLGYAEQMVEVFAGHRDLENPSGGFTPRLSERPLTKFEQRAARDGRQTADVYVTRRLST
jgi:tRNA (guanine-N7-)-methyltransferase